MNNEDKVKRIKTNVLFILAENQEKKQEILFKVTSKELLGYLYGLSDIILKETYKKHPDILSEYNESDLKVLEATFHEAVGLASYIYYVEKCQIEGDDINLPKDDEFKRYILKGLNDYLIENTKSEDDLVPSYILEVIKHFSLTILELLSNTKAFMNISQKARSSITMQIMWVIVGSYEGYILQERYMVPHK